MRSPNIATTGACSATGGSIRIPASFTGIVGHKPTFGTVPAWPGSAFGTVAHLGPMTRSVADTAAMLNAMSGRDLRDWAQGWRAADPVAPVRLELEGRRIGYWRTPPGVATEPQIQARIEATLRDLEIAGAIVVPVDLPMLDELPEIFNLHWLVGAACRLSSIDAADHDKLDPGFLDAARAGARYSAVERMQGENARAQFGAQMDALLDKLDFLVSPAVAISPFSVGRSVPEGSGWNRWMKWAGFSYPINLSQQPACSVPCGLTSDGLPVGLQFVGARGSDETVLSAALAIEKMYPDRFLLSGEPWPTALREHWT